MAMDRKRRSATISEAGKARKRAGRSLAPEAFEVYDDVDPKVAKAIQDRAYKVLKKGKWVVVDGDASDEPTWTLRPRRTS